MKKASILASLMAGLLGNTEPYHQPRYQKRFRKHGSAKSKVKVTGTVAVSGPEELNKLRTKFSPAQVRAVRRKTGGNRYHHMLSRANSVW